MIVCADDFGLTTDINRAVIHLAGQERISAASCMVALSHFDRMAFSGLLKYRDRLDIGLHLTLTDSPPTHAVAGVKSLLQSSSLFHSMGSLLRRGIVGALNPDDVAREIRSQFDRFVEYAGCPPDYLDSHLHVHQFPGVRDGMLRFLDTLDPETGPYIRNSAMTVGKAIRQGVSPLKCLAIGFPGAYFREALEQRGWRTNHGFAGIYAYDGHHAYPVYLSRFAECMETRTGIIMTHPGESEPWREIEYRTLLDADCLTGQINKFCDA
ncbi:MAG: ChbG/HpnK family deacetylase [bacterium]